MLSKYGPSPRSVKAVQTEPRKTMEETICGTDEF